MGLLEINSIAVLIDFMVSGLNLNVMFLWLFMTY